MTKAEFSKQMLDFLELQTPRGAPSSAESWEVLTELGFLPAGPPGSPLTEGDLSELARKAGLELRTDQPDRAVNPQKARSFLFLFSSNLQSALGSASHPNRGKAHEIHLSPTARERRAKRRGPPVSPSDPNATATAFGEPLP